MSEEINQHRRRFFRFSLLGQSSERNFHQQSARQQASANGKRLLLRLRHGLLGVDQQIQEHLL